jgi:hypothetical protein
MLRGLAAGATGAAAYTAYHEARLSGELGSDNGQGGSALALAASAVLAVARRLLLALAGAAGGNGNGSSDAALVVQRLQRQVDDLQHLLLRSSTAATTTNNNNKKGATVATAAAIAALATTLAIAIKCYPSLLPTLPDLMYATRGSVKHLRASLEQSVATLREQVRGHAADMGNRLKLVSSKTDAVLEAQQELERALARVEGGVGLVRGDVAALAQRVEYGNRAVTLLCGVVGEVARAVGLPAASGGGGDGGGRTLDGLMMLEKQQEQQQHDSHHHHHQLLLPGEEEAPLPPAPPRPLDAASRLLRAAADRALLTARAPNPATYHDLVNGFGGDGGGGGAGGKAGPSPPPPLPRAGFSVLASAAAASSAAAAAPPAVAAAAAPCW